MFIYHGKEGMVDQDNLRRGSSKAKKGIGEGTKRVYNVQKRSINDLVPGVGPASCLYSSIRPSHHEYIKRLILDQFLKPSGSSHPLADNQVHNPWTFKEHLIFKTMLNAIL